MTIHKINSPIKTISKIYHTGDIHIRLYKRMDEYQEVFENLYSAIRKDFNDESIIVLSGDIVHSKTEMSPEMVMLVSDLLRNLADIGPTIVTAGNHDCNLNNKQRMDAITPIVKTLNHKNLFYLKKSALYSMGDNVVFSSMGVFDQQSNYIKADAIPNDKIKIALFHGTIDSVSLDNGFILKDSKTPVSLFDGFDIALVADIHLHQVLQRYDAKNKKPCIAYPSSLIQQNHGENLNRHGILVWDVQKRDFEFRRIKNRYGYITLNVDKGKLTSDISDMPERPRIRLMVNDTSQAELKNCLIDLRQKFDPHEMTTNSVSSLLKSSDVADKIDLTQIRTVEFQNKLIHDYLVKNYNIDDSVYSEIYSINKRLNSLLEKEEITRNIIWKPKRFTFSNMFSYDENNVIDFENIKGIAGLFAPNASGKSSLLEALAFCLFDKCSRAFKAIHVLNNRKEEFSCELCFEIDGIDYFIKKVGKKTKPDAVSVKIDFWKIDKDGNKIDLNGEQRKDTSSIIKSYVGTYEDFVLTALSFQGNNTNFIDLGQTDRKELLAQFMDITIFDKLFDLGSGEIKEYSVLLKEFEDRDFASELQNIETQLITSEKQKSSLSSLKQSLTNDRKLLNECILELTKKLVEIKTGIGNIESLKRIRESILSDVTFAENDLKSASDKLAVFLTKYSDIKSKMEDAKFNDIEKNYESLVSLRDALKKIIMQRDELKIHVNHKLEKIQNLGKLEYDENCKYCMNNVFVKDAIQTEKEIVDDKNALELIVEKKLSIESNIESIKIYDDLYAEYKKNLSLMESIKSESLAWNSKKGRFETTLVTLKNNLQKTDDSIALYYQNEEAIVNNETINQKIKKFNEKISDVDAKLSSVEKELISVSSTVMFLNSKKSDVNSDIKKFEEMEIKYNSYQYYLEAIHRDGIQYELISKAVPAIEHGVNNILGQIVDFGILLQLDGKNINSKIVYDEDKFWPLELASGMEKFISGLAIRVALLSISNLPRPTFLAIDEGFSTMDPDNASNLPSVFTYLKNQFEFVFVISHMDFMRDFVDISLDLKKSDGYSKITYK